MTPGTSSSTATLSVDLGHRVARHAIDDDGNIGGVDALTQLPSRVH